MKEIRATIELICQLFQLGELSGWWSAEKQDVENYTRYEFRVSGSDEIFTYWQMNP